MPWVIIGQLGSVAQSYELGLTDIDIYKDNYSKFQHGPSDGGTTRSLLHARSCERQEEVGLDLVRTRRELEHHTVPDLGQYKYHSFSDNCHCDLGFSDLRLCVTPYAGC